MLDKDLCQKKHICISTRRTRKLEYEMIMQRYIYCIEYEYLMTVSLFIRTAHANTHDVASQIEHEFDIGNDQGSHDMEIHPPPINLDNFSTPKKRATSGLFYVSTIITIIPLKSL